MAVAEIQFESEKERAKEFVKRWQKQLSEVEKDKGERQFAQVFWIDLYETFAGSYEPDVFEQETSGGKYPDVCSLKCGFIAEQKSKGINLDTPELRGKEKVTPFEQAMNYYKEMVQEEKPIKTIVTCNFETFRFYDVTTKAGRNGRIAEECVLEEIPEKLELFKELFRGKRIKAKFSILDEESTKEVAKSVSKFYNILERGIDDLFKEAKADEDLELKKAYKAQIPMIVMRTVFCLFANNTSDDLGKIFKNDEFETFINKTDPESLGKSLFDLFLCLNTKKEPEFERLRAGVSRTLWNFPYVDGGLFAKVPPTPFTAFPDKAYTALRELLDFKDWDEIDISVFGTIMDNAFPHDERREGGMYYTSKKGIQKVIEPLFMDPLREEFEKIKAVKDWTEQHDKLTAFHDKLTQLQFFDPSCGSGNFLTEAFMELRELEDDVIELENSSAHDLDKDIKISLSQFHGIEINEYVTELAKLALQIAREQALEKSYARFKETAKAPQFIPLKKNVEGIICGNSLEIDWLTLVKPSSNLFIFGNPPYAGAHITKDGKNTQKKELEDVFGALPYSELDYCAAWYYKAAKFLDHSGGTFAFLSTNSVTEGIQVLKLFKPIMNMGWRISFAYPSFSWSNEGATVTVCIIGMSQSPNTYPKLWDNKGFKEVKNITPYELLEAPTMFVENKTTPISILPDVCMGSQPIDGHDKNINGVILEGLVLEDETKRNEALKNSVITEAKKQGRDYVRLYLGGNELIHNKSRWCLWLVDSTREDRQKSKFLKKRIEEVEEYRKTAKSPVKASPWLFANDRQPDCNYLAIPAQFSEKRSYFTADFLNKNVIASNTLYVASDPDGFAFSVIESSMFMAWQDLVGGRLKTDNRFSNTLVWNTFPLPELTKEQKDRIIDGGRKVLESRALIRKKDPTASLADMYSEPAVLDPDLEKNLLKAHEALDKAVDSVFSNKPLKSEEERQKVLFEAYGKIKEAEEK